MKQGEEGYQENEPDSGGKVIENKREEKNERTTPYMLYRIHSEMGAREEFIIWRACLA